ncbi:hypothetical protein K488DRAFT_74163 [Vararia minispora EC-137]|uniref:Uncharacterized protein n=1 Tax=Vararia minispora EC-137 TaxID=1314806 RepID=A0ACB8Q8J2_9AGAM|nr:hypothetical protein K488DRAFT_74163 [Vararia minispora EC-137]
MPPPVLVPATHNHTIPDYIEIIYYTTSIHAALLQPLYTGARHAVLKQRRQASARDSGASERGGRREVDVDTWDAPVRTERRHKNCGINSPDGSRDDDGESGDDDGEDRDDGGSSNGKGGGQRRVTESRQRPTFIFTLVGKKKPEVSIVTDVSGRCPRGRQAQAPVMRPVAETAREGKACKTTWGGVGEDQSRTHGSESGLAKRAMTSFAHAQQPVLHGRNLGPNPIVVASLARPSCANLRCYHRQPSA